MNLNRSIALLTIRLLLAIIFFLQGYGKVVTWGVENLYQMDFFKGAYEHLLPDFVIYSTAYYTSYVELIGGFLLLIGWKKNWALYALSSVLIIVSIGHGLIDPIWDLSHVMYRAILLVALLLLPSDWDRFSIDEVLSNKKD